MKRLVLIFLAALLVLLAATASASAAKKPTLASLAKAIKTIQVTNAKQTRQIKALQTLTKTQATTIAALSSQLATANAALAAIESNKALTLGPYVSVSSEALNGVRGPHILFTGANVHIRSGSGRTDDNVPNGGVLTGLGNLIIGYDEPVSAGGAGPQPRTGSHCLLVGAEHTWQSYGGLVAG